jgi:hypothetical protein
MRQPFMTRSGILPGAILAVLLAGGLTACSSGRAGQTGQAGRTGQAGQAEAGSLRTLLRHGKPAVTSGSVAPGQQAEFAAYVDNTGGPVTLVSASLIPIAGHPAGHLAAVAVSQRRGPLGFARGWPPDSPVVPFAGARIGPGDADVVFAMAGARPGTYMAAGLSIVYRYHGHRYTMRAYAASVACVTTKARATASCPAAARQAGLATQKLAT